MTLGQTKAGQVQYVHLSEEAAEILRKLDTWSTPAEVRESEAKTIAASSTAATQ